MVKKRLADVRGGETEMATSREFQCPGCKRMLNMTDEMHMVAIMYQGGGSFMGFGSFDLKGMASCPHCNAVMPIEDIVAGRYSPGVGHPLGEVLGSVLGCGGVAAMFAGMVFLIRWCSS